MRFTGAMCVAAVAALAGCGAADGLEGDVGSLEQASGGGYLYQCRHLKDPAVVAEVFVGPGTATFSSSDPALKAVDGDYTYQPKYKPRTKKHDGQALYSWTGPGGHKMSLYVDKAMRSGGDKLKIGKRGGFVDLEGPYLAHTGDHFLCYR